MDEEPTSGASGAENGEATAGLIRRLRERGEELAKGRRLVVTLPGWEDVGGGEGLWARFKPLTREMQQTYGWTPSTPAAEREVMAPLIAACCEEILLGTREERRPLADEPEIAGARTDGGPLLFSAELGAILGVGGRDGEACVKRMFIRGEDDILLYAVWGELLNWSGDVQTEGVEVAAGE